VRNTDGSGAAAPRFSRPARQPGALLGCAAEDAPPVVLVHGYPDAVAALRASAATGRRIRLLCPAEATGGLGPHAVREMIAAAQGTVPEAENPDWAVDCGPHAGLALAAIRAGVPVLRVSLPEAVRLKLADIGRQSGTRVLDSLSGDPLNRPALDLCREVQPFSACMSLLMSTADPFGQTATGALPTQGGSCI
jgi:hypothetical protein